MQLGFGGTANLAVLGGNVPPSQTHEDRSPLSEDVVRLAVGLVARQNGPVARSTRTSTESFRLSDRPGQGACVTTLHVQFSCTAFKA